MSAADWREVYEAEVRGPNVLPRIRPDVLARAERRIAKVIGIDAVYSRRRANRNRKETHPMRKFMRPATLLLIALCCAVALAQAATAKLAWDVSPSAGVVSYNVYRSTTQGSGYVKIGSSTTLAYTDATVPSTGQRFYYVVTSVNAGGAESGFSNEVFFVESPAAPPNVRVVP